MDHHLTRERHTRQDDPAGSLAVDLLAYAAMGDNGALERRTLEASGADLGRAIVVWYRMCETQNDTETVTQLARQTAQRFQTAMNEIMESLEGNTQNAKDHAVALSMGRGLLIDLATDQTDRFEELWASVVTNYDVPIIMETVGLMLGFACGILNGQTVQP